MLKTSEFDFALPPELIAQRPCQEREKSRLMVLDRETKKIEHRMFFEIGDFLKAGDLLVLNDTKVIPAKLTARKPTGGKVEALLLEKINDRVFEVLVKPGKRTPVGATLIFKDGISATVAGKTNFGGRILEFNAPPPLESIGEIPLPPYITQPQKDISRYQTVYAKKDGASAAPTAGFHFTRELLDKLKEKGVDHTFITLHTGLATFRPVKTQYVKDHEIHSEYFEITKDAAEAVNSKKGRVIAVGTTSARALESAAKDTGKLEAKKERTDLFIYPPCKFKVVDALVTNFHFPKSTLLMLVSAFAGREFILKAYGEAIKERYRFFSFGDAMLIC